MATNTSAKRIIPLMCGQKPLAIPTPEKEKNKVFWASVITISFNLYLLKACNRDSRVTSVVRNSYTPFHKLAMPVVLLDILLLGTRLHIIYALNI